MLGEVLNAEEKAMQLTIDALKDAAAWPGPDQRTLVVLGNAMNARSPYPDVEVPDTSPPEFVPDRADVRGAAVPLMGPADHGSAGPLMGPATAGTITPLMGPAAPATVTPLLGPADHGTMVPLMGPADPGTATPLMLPSR
jgi:hypothetical protein